MCKNSGFRLRIQKSYKKFGIESKNLIIFSESIPNLYPLCLSLSHTDLTDLTGFLCGWEISRMLYGLWFFVGSHRSHRSHRVSLWVGNLMDALWFVVFCGLTRISQIPPFLLWVENLTEALRFVVFCGLTRISQIPPFLLWVGNLTEALRFVVFCGLTQISRDSTRRLFVEICDFVAEKQHLFNPLKIH